MENKEKNKFSIKEITDNIDSVRNKALVYATIAFTVLFLILTIVNNFTGNKSSAMTMVFSIFFTTNMFVEFRYRKKTIFLVVGIVMALIFLSAVYDYVILLIH